MSKYYAIFLFVISAAWAQQPAANQSHARDHNSLHRRHPVSCGLPRFVA